MTLAAALAAGACDLAHTAFSSPIWNARDKKWFRALTLSTGETDASPHYYYDLCNIYGIQRAMELVPELRRHAPALMDAAGWLYWLLRDTEVLGYESARLETSKDRYTLALAPAALCAGYAITPFPALLRLARQTFARYRACFPINRQAPCVQASNHHILSALALAALTGEQAYLDDAAMEGRFLLEACRFTEGPAAGTFTDDHQVTAFSRHCYGAWAMMALYAALPNEAYVEAARTSLDWWQRAQLSNGGFYFFYDANHAAWTDKTVYSVHQKGMALLSAWDIDAASGGRYRSMIETAMRLCDDPAWQVVSPQGWRAYRRSDVQTDVVYSYELGWEILGHAKGAWTLRNAGKV